MSIKKSNLEIQSKSQTESQLKLESKLESKLKIPNNIQSINQNKIKIQIKKDIIEKINININKYKIKNKLLLSIEKIIKSIIKKINLKNTILPFLITGLILFTNIITMANANSASTTNSTKYVPPLEPFCGNGINPKSSKDCINYSTKDFHCCKMYMENSIAEFNTCYKIMKNYTYSSIINMGKSTYRIDCSGIKDYYKYFPFEERFDPCGISYPKTISSCSDYLMENKNSRCCYGKIKTFPDYGNCYSTIGLTSNVVNYTTYYGDELTLFCSKSFLSYKIKIFSLNFVLIFIYSILVLFM